MKIKIIQPYGQGEKRVKAGEVFEARTLNREGIFIDSYPNFQMIEGPAMGLIVPFHCVVVLSAGRTYTKDEYEKIVADLAEHGRTIAGLENRNKELNELLDMANGAVDALAEELEGKKVELPCKVAEAIQSFRDEGHDLDYIIANLALDIQKPTSRLQTLKTYAYKYGYTLIAALINGYTIEQLPEDKLKEGIKNICDEFNISARDDVGYDDISSLAFRVANFVEKNIKS